MIPALLLAAMMIGFLRRVDLFDAFADGALEGLKSAARIVPCLAATLTALRIMQASGLMDALQGCLTPLAKALGLPGGVAPLLWIRPLSGSASLAFLEDILRRYGPDSPTGLAASAMMGSGETVLYTCAVYLSAAGIRKTRYVIPVSLAGWLVGCLVTGMFFR